MTGNIQQKLRSIIVLMAKYFFLLGITSNYSKFSSYRHLFHVVRGYIKEAQSTENSTSIDTHNFTGKNVQVSAGSGSKFIGRFQVFIWRVWY
jgi:hypothetical protein